MRSLDERLFHPLCLTQATLSGSGVLGSLTAKLGKPAGFRRARNLQLIEEALEELERRILVIILDEAQNYAHSSLEEVRLLLGLNLPEQPAFALILIGDEYLLSSLKLRNHRALYSRLACQVSLPVWTPSQCAQYLSASLVAAGLSAQVLEPAAQRTAEQRQRRSAPQPEPAGSRGVDRCRQPRRPKDHRCARPERPGNRALCAGPACRTHWWQLRSLTTHVRAHRQPANPPGS